MLALIESLNGRDDIDGILIQLPLPAHVDTRRLLEAVSPAKDVDGFHPINAGRLLAEGYSRRNDEQVRQTRSCPMHTRRNYGNSAPLEHPHRRQKCRCRGPFRHRWQTCRLDADQRLGHGDRLPQPDRRSRSIHARGRSSGRRDWPSRLCHGGDGQARSDSDRCGHQSRYGRRRGRGLLSPAIKPAPLRLPSAAPWSLETSIPPPLRWQERIPPYPAALAHSRSQC